MDINEYQKDAFNTAIYPNAGTGVWEALSYCGLGLGEAGEIQGKIKKVLRDEGGLLTDKAKREIAKEMGDLLWYVACLATEMGYSLEDIATGNIAKLADREERGVLKGSGDNR